VLITWKTAVEHNTSQFNIERSANSINWEVIGNRPSSGNSDTQTSYSFTDNDPGQNDYYRIAGYDKDGKVQYSGILRSSCNATDVFRLWPNPVHDIVLVNIVSANQSPANDKNI